MPARLLLRQRTVLGPGEFTEVNAWAVKRTGRFPKGVKFAFAYVQRIEGKGIRVYRMDNAHGKGPHEHLGGKVGPLESTDWQDLLRHFQAAVKRLRSGVE
ncbi:MAG: hypothetical protein HY556_07505 [Euryarchaeota archaeon]|nr:hypothetical protein [Euryarchaeota archaeon]